MNFHKLILTQTVGSSMAGTIMAVPLSFEQNASKHFLHI